MWQAEVREHTRHNFTMNILDGAFFGLALGFASSVTVIPLFLNTLTDSTLLIGVVTSMHTIGWQIPQLFTSGYVSRLLRYKPMVMFMTVHERWPFFGLALLALLAATLGPGLTVALAVILLGIHGFGGGLTATAWQSMIGKIMPLERRGTFFGLQSGAANMLAAGGALAAGILLERLPSPIDFALCFGLAGIAMMISLVFLGRTREPAHERVEAEGSKRPTLNRLIDILRRDKNFRWFLLARVLAQIGWMAVAFYTIYAVRAFNMDEKTAGVLTSILMLSQTVASPLLGWAGDRWGHRAVFAGGALMIGLSATLALAAPELSWFYIAFGLAGASNAAVWAVAMTLTLEFGAEGEKPLYVGLTNTIIGPVGLVAPLIGGGLADSFGFGATFGLSIACAVLTSAVMLLAVRRPGGEKLKVQPPVLAPSLEDSGVW